MSAHLVIQAPIGSIVSWSDDAPRPPERHHKKLSAWKTNNSSGRLICKQPPYFTLHEGDLGSGGVIVISIRRTFSIESRLQFTVTERPAIGSVRVFDRPGDDAELVYLASHRADAEEWLTRHGYPRAVLEEVTADEVAAEHVEGRDAA